MFPAFILIAPFLTITKFPEQLTKLDGLAKSISIISPAINVIVFVEVKLILGVLYKLLIVGVGLLNTPPVRLEIQIGLILQFV
jgi:hypothetical protein